MKETLNNLLSKLPFNGWKTALGFVGTVVAPHLPGIVLLTFPGGAVLTLPALLAGLAFTYGTVGVVHKSTK